MRLAETQQEHKRKKESTAPHSRKLINLLTKKKMQWEKTTWL